jgi:hypothetical protein
MDDSLYERISYCHGIQTGVIFRLYKTYCEHAFVHGRMPVFGRLCQPLQALAQAPHFSLIVRIDMTPRLFNKDVL